VNESEMVAINWDWEPKDIKRGAREKEKSQLQLSCISQRLPSIPAAFQRDNTVLLVR
jgi:hypothetical protein